MNTIKEATTFYSTDFSTIWYSIPNELRHEFYEEIKSLGVKFYTNKEVNEEDIGCFMSEDPVIFDNLKHAKI